MKSIMLNQINYLFIILCLFISTQNIAATLHVKESPVGNESCSSWDNACDLMTALNQATVGDDIWVAAGIYHPSDNNINVSFELKDGVNLYGGFPNNGAPAFEDRDWLIHRTILSGDLEDDDPEGELFDPIIDNIKHYNYVSFNNNLNSITVLKIFDIIQLTTIDGIIVTAGLRTEFATPSGIEVNNATSNLSMNNIMLAGNYGGGLTLNTSSPTITNLYYIGNQKGIRFINNSNPTIYNAIISGNYNPTSGGGLTNSESNPIIVNSVFHRNETNISGAAIYNTNNSTITIENSIVWKNKIGNSEAFIQVFNDIGNNTTTFLNSIIQNSPSNNWQPGNGDNLGNNLADDPLFIDANGADNITGTIDDNLRLQSNSPAINQGNNDAIQGIDFDLDLQSRVVNNIVDIGPYEYQGAEPVTYQLNVTINGVGLVKSNQEDIDCEPTCQANFDEDESVTLTASTDEYNAFESWTNDCQGNNESIQIAMNNNKSCTANFIVTKFKLFTATNGSGDGSIDANPNGLNCGNNCQAYDVDTDVTLTANAANDSEFIQWNGGNCQGNVNGNEITLTMDSVKDCIATFNKKQFNLITSVNGDGSIDVSPPGVNCGPNCQTYEIGKNITLTATANNGSQFVNWSNNCGDNSHQTQISINNNITCTANFEPIPPNIYALTINVIGSGNVESDDQNINCGNDCNEVYVENTVVNLTATADPGFVFSQWAGNCDGNNNPLQITMNETKNCDAIFTQDVPDSSTLTVIINGDGSGKVISNDDQIDCEPTCQGSYSENSNVQLSVINLAPGSFIEAWGKDCLGQQGNVVNVQMNSNKICELTIDQLSTNLFSDGFEN